MVRDKKADLGKYRIQLKLHEELIMPKTEYQALRKDSQLDKII